MKATKSEVERDGNPKSIRAGNHPGNLWRAVPVGFAGFLGLLLSLAVPLAAAAGLPVARNLQADGQMAAREHLPVLIFFYAHSCAYCKEVDELYLQPRYADATYRNKAIFRAVNIRSDRALRDFSGRMTSDAAFASHYNVSLTPTIKLFDGHGREVVPSLVGVTNPDFYGSYLDAAVATADNKLRTESAPSPTAFVRAHGSLH